MNLLGKISEAKKYVKTHLYERLSVQMTFLTFMCVLVLASITTYMQVYNENEHRREDISKTISLYHNQIEIFLIPAIKSRDRKNLELFIDSLAREPYIAYAELDIYNPQQPEAASQTPDAIVRGEKPNLQLNNTIVKTMPIKDGDVEIGFLEVISDPEYISELVKNKLTLIISLSLFIAVSISATILLLMHALIIKHLRYLAMETQEFSVSNINHPIFLPNRKDDLLRNELDVLVESINKMRKTLAKEISANKNKNIALKNQRDFSTTLLNYCNLVICRLDPKFNIISINSTATLLTGYLEVEVSKKPWSSVFVEESRRKEAEAQIKQSNHTIINELTMRDQDGKLLYMEWKFVPFYEGQNLKYHIAFGYDVTQLKEAQQQLISLNNDLESKIAMRTQTLKKTNDELTRAYQDLKEAQKQLIESETMSSLGSLVSGISHEINTPLGVSVTAHTLIAEQVKRMEKLLEEPEIDRDELREMIEIITESDDILTSNLKRASELIRSFKQVAVDSSSNISYTFNLKENISQTLMSLSNVVKKERLYIQLDCPEKLEIFSYPGALNQIYTNLIMNSASHAWDTQKDNRRISILIKEENGNIVIDYRDNGNGISPDIINKIYEPFVTSKRGKGGSGLGANIIYNLTTQLLNGKIECCNLDEPEHGARFTITFPAVKEEPKKNS